MNLKPNVRGNPLKISVYVLPILYFVGEFLIPKYPLVYFVNLIGVLGLILSLFFFFNGFNLFSSYKENPLPNSESSRLIKTGIFAYTRNPIYISFVLFHLSMFFAFENVMYFLSTIALFIWLHNFVIKKEEDYLYNKFGDEYSRYCDSVKRWMIF